MCILDEVNEIIDGKRYNHYVAALCLFHDDHQPSLMIYQDVYRCVACGAFGSTKALLTKLRSGNIDKVTTTLKPAPRNPFNRWLRKNKLPDILKSSYITQCQHPEWCGYLEERKIDAHTRKIFKIGNRDNFFLLPIVEDTRKVVGVVARAGRGFTGSRYYIPDGQNPNLIYSTDNYSRREGKLFLTFGIFDAISVYLCGHRCLSTTTGKQLDASALDRYRERIYFLPDADEYIDAKKITHRLGWRGKVIKIDYPDGTKDMNDLLITHPKLLQQILMEA